MTSERTASGPRVRHVLTGAFHDFGRAWRELLATDVLYKVLAFGILTPLVGIALRAFVSTSGNSVLADTDILFFLSPVGLLALVVLSALSLAIVALEQARRLPRRSRESGDSPLHPKGAPPRKRSLRLDHQRSFPDVENDQPGSR